jgi:hypothetical protein
LRTPRSCPGTALEASGYAAVRGLNSKIQSVKSAARGFHSFESYRARILLFCGKLDMSPIASHSN